MYRIIQILTSLCLLAGCKSAPSADVMSIDIDLTRKIIPIQESGLIKEYEIVKLETRDDALIGDIDKIVVHDSLIYIADFQRQWLFIYNTDGGFVRKIDRRGRAANEYLQMNDFFVDERDNTLNILDRNPSKILKFNLDGSRELQIVTLGAGEIWLQEIVPHDDIYIGYSGNTSLQNTGKNIWMIDRTGKVIDAQLDIPAGWESNSFGGVTAFSRYKQDICFMDLYFNVYKLKNNNFTPFFNLDFGAFGWPKTIGSAADYRAYRENRSNREFISDIYRYQETEKYMIFNHIFQGQNVVSLYDKNTGESGTYSTMESNKESCYIQFGTIVSLTENRMITSIDALRVARLLDENEEIAVELAQEYPEQIRRLKEKVGDIKTEDNPVLVFYDIN